MNVFEIVKQDDININYINNNDDFDSRGEDRENIEVPNEGARKRKDNSTQKVTAA
jgi:hypothetical protein